MATVQPIRQSQRGIYEMTLKRVQEEDRKKQEMMDEAKESLAQAKRDLDDEETFSTADSSKLQQAQAEAAAMMKNLAIDEKSLTAPNFEDVLNMSQLTEAAKKMKKLDEPPAEVGDGFMQKFNTKAKKGKMGISERAEAKFHEEAVSEKPLDDQELKNQEISEMLDNPLTELYNLKHPEVMKNAKEFQYGYEQD